MSYLVWLMDEYSFKLKSMKLLLLKARDYLWKQNSLIFFFKAEKFLLVWVRHYLFKQIISPLFYYYYCIMKHFYYHNYRFYKLMQKPSSPSPALIQPLTPWPLPPLVVWSHLPLNHHQCGLSSYNLSHHFHNFYHCHSHCMLSHAFVFN